MPSEFSYQLKKLRPEWHEFSLNYEELYEKLVEVKREFGLRKAKSSALLIDDNRTFVDILDQDVEKMVLFYLRTQGDLANRLWNLREDQMIRLKSFRISMEVIEEICQSYRELCQVSYSY